MCRSDTAMSPPKSGRSVQLNNSQTLPCEIICVLLTLLYFGRAAKCICIGASYVAICSSGMFERFLVQNTRGIRSFNVLVEGASIWCTQKVINLAQSTLDMVGLVDGLE